MNKENLNSIFTDILTEDTSYYNVGDSIKYDLESAANDNPGKDVSFGYGMVVAKSGMDYILKLDNGQEIKVKNGNAYAYGNADGDANP